LQSGIRDAFNIGWKLVEVLQGRMPEAVLDSYETERAPNVELMTQAAVSLGRIIRREVTVAELAPGANLPGQAMIEMPNRKDPMLDAGWVRGPITPEGIIGKMVPQPLIADAQGRLCLLDETLGHGFALIGDGVDPADLLSVQDKADWDRLNARHLRLIEPKNRGRSGRDIIDLDGALLHWMREHGVRVMALRPDRFVAAADTHGLAVPSY